MHDVIQKKSEKTTDAAGRGVQILRDHNALMIADDLRKSVRDVYEEALRLGILPYRYLRNLDSVSPEEQLKLAESQVAVIGAGGLGGFVIILLARMGIGHLAVVDQDIFEETNLNRQALCTMKTIGNPKAREALYSVAAVNPGVKVTPYQTKLNPSNVEEILTGSEVIVDALDNVPDRFLLEEAAKKMEIPLVHGALAGFEGWVMTIFPGDPGLKNIYGAKEESENNAESPQALLGVPGVTPSLIATMQVMEVLKILLKRGNIIRNRMLHIDLERGSFNEFFFEVIDSPK
jgi:molybdopterin/thiamine biosynthesis adenylyltransferase